RALRRPVWPSARAPVRPPFPGPGRGRVAGGFVTRLAVVGGTVLLQGGPVRSDVNIARGRIVSVDPNVGTTGAGSGGPGGSSDGSTVGAGAERAGVDAPFQRDVEPAAGDIDPVAGDVSSARAAGRLTRLDATGLVVAPGFIDLQCNGAVGVDLTAEPERMWEVAAALPRWGVTAWLPTVVSAPPHVRSRARTIVVAGPPRDPPPGASALGLHLEGPFLAAERAGAHDRRHL